MTTPTKAAPRIQGVWWVFFGLLLCAGLVRVLAVVHGDDSARDATIPENHPLEIVEQNNKDGSTTLRARLTNCTEMTITFSLKLDNMSASVDSPFTVDSKGRTNFDLVTLRQAEKGRPWHYRYRYFWELGGRGDVRTNSFIYELPYRDGKHEVIQADFGGYSHQEGSSDEHAIDFGMPIGTPVCAARDGTVVAIRQDSDIGGGDKKYETAANYVIVKHADDTFAEYYHLKKNGVAVSLGQKVNTGDTLGYSGSTGFSSGPHLHFAVFETIDGQTRRTFPLHFETKPGKVQSLKEGRSY